MADRLLLESGAPDGYLLEDSSGVLLSEADCFYDTAISLSPTFYARMGDSAGPTVVEEINANNGTAFNSPTFGATSLLSGDSNTAITLVRASSQRIEFPDHAALDTGDVFSIAFLSRRTSTGTNQTILDKGTTGGTGFLVYWNASNRIRLATSGAGVAIVQGPVSTDTTTEHLYVFTKNGGTTKVYVDGVDSSTAGTPATLGNTSNALFVGREAGGGTNFADDTLDEILIWAGVALTQADIDRLQASRATSCAVSTQGVDLPVINGSAAIYAPSLQFVLSLPVIDGGAAIYAPSLQFVITLPVIDGSAAIYAPTILPQPVTITVGLIDSGAAIYAPTVAAAPATITLSLLDGGAVIYDPVLTLSAYLSSTVISRQGRAGRGMPGTRTYGMGSLPFAQTVTLTLLDGGAAIYAPTILPVSTVTLFLLDGSSAIYAPSLLAVSTLTLGLIDSGAAIYAPTVIPVSVTITLGLLDGGAALYAPTIVNATLDTAFVTLSRQMRGGRRELHASRPRGPGVHVLLRDIVLPLIDSGSAIYAPSIAFEADAYVNVSGTRRAGYEIRMTRLVGPGVVTNTQTVTVGLIDAGSAIYAPTLLTKTTVTLGLITSASAIYAPTIAIGGIVTTITLPLLDGSSAIYQITLTGRLYVHDALTRTTGYYPRFPWYGRGLRRARGHG